MVNKPDVFQRLVGLETEYALLHAGPARQAARQPLRPFASWSRRCSEDSLRPRRNMKEGVFHAAGGAVWFETERPALGGGLIEGSTPECRSPRQLLAWQRAQDELLAEASQTPSAARFA